MRAVPCIERKVMFCSITVHCYMGSLLFSVVAFFAIASKFKVTYTISLLMVLKLMLLLKKTTRSSLHKMFRFVIYIVVLHLSKGNTFLARAYVMRFLLVKPVLRNSLSNRLIKRGNAMRLHTHLTVHFWNYCFKMSLFVHYYLYVSVTHPCHNKKYDRENHDSIQSSDDRSPV